MESRQGARAHPPRRLHGVVFAESRAARGARARRLDTRGPAAGALADPAAQIPLGQRAGEIVDGSPAVVLLSGGLDSATALAIAREQGFICHALSVDYGPRHAAELDPARRVARAGGAREHRVMGVDLAGIGGSALTDLRLAVPEAPTTGIPITYVPARNTIMLSLGLAWAEGLGAPDGVIGVNVAGLDAPP